MKMWTIILALLVGWGATGRAQYNAEDQIEGLRQVKIDQRLGNALPLDLTFRDEDGQTVRLGDYFHDRPVVVSLVYYECPMLCTLVLNGMLKAFRVLPFTTGQEFEVVTISIDPSETAELAATKKAEYLKKYDRPGAGRGWHFLTGEEAQIRQLADAMGFGYVYQPERDEYAHAAAIMLATPEGKLSKYYYGIEYSARDLRLGIVEAATEKIGTLADQVLLFCFHYDPLTGQYGVAIMRVVRLAGFTTVGLLAGFIILMLRRERKGRESATDV